MDADEPGDGDCDGAAGSCDPPPPARGPAGGLGAPSLGKASLVAIAVGFSMGPLSMTLLRDRPAFDSFHSMLGIIVLGFFAWTGWSGRALLRGSREARDIHRFAAASSLGAALLSAVAGFILLP